MVAGNSVAAKFGSLENPLPGDTGRLQKPRIDDPARLFPGQLAQLMGLRVRGRENVPNLHTAAVFVTKIG